MQKVVLVLLCLVDGRSLRHNTARKNGSSFLPLRALSRRPLGLARPLPSFPVAVAIPSSAKALGRGRIYCRDGLKKRKKNQSFAILEDHHPERPGLQLVGPREVRKSLFSVDALKRRLLGAQQRHDEINKIVSDLDQRVSAAWFAEELRELKKRKLQLKDRTAALTSAVRRLEEAQAWELGSGNFGNVLLGRDQNGGLVAVKVTFDASNRNSAKSQAFPTNARSPSSLQTEALVLQELTRRRELGFPRFLYFGRQELTLEGSRNDADILVMGLLGPSIDDLWFPTNAGTQFSAGCVHQMAVQMLERLQRLHAAGWVHNDVKPANFLMGLPAPGNDISENLSSTRRINLVDMGLCTRIEPTASKLPHPAFGTLLFASRTAHRGMPTMPEDDVESLCYCLAYLLTGKLPWSGAEDEMAVVAEKDMVASSNGDHLFVGLQAEDEAASALASSIALLWRTQEQQRHCHGKVIGDHMDQSSAAQQEYSYEAAWPARCRAAMQLRREIDKVLGESAYDWEAAGVAWSPNGDIFEHV